MATIASVNWHFTSFTDTPDGVMVFDASLWAAYPPCSSFMCIFPLAFLNNCSGLSTSAMQNSCWCPNVSWLTNVASCVGQRCPSEVAQVYSTIESACITNGGFQTGITLDDWISAAHSLPPAPVISGVVPPCRPNKCVATHKKKGEHVSKCARSRICSYLNSELDHCTISHCAPKALQKCSKNAPNATLHDNRGCGYRKICCLDNRLLVMSSSTNRCFFSWPVNVQ